MEGRRLMPERGRTRATRVVADYLHEDREREGAPELPGTYTGVTNLISVRGRPDQRGGLLSPVGKFMVEARFSAGLARGSFQFGLRVLVGDAAPHMLHSREVRLVDGRQEVRLTRG